ncbi:hypothetical protein [Variovorax sp. DXTD-1]|uniref:hypothetical protein n=1 Tax=Variovorax sp. DXTD-1 TaxID=2495592 RepID=UPI000F881B58|nr:hypothetical protein [Variovorax sp. DXTD-1]RST45036.1 hypothetical protein EJI00_24450 [Variovorax sp. DXTD-1]
MRKQFPWAKVFALQTTIFVTAITASMAIGGALLVPFLVWVFTDIWQWSSINRWLRFVILGAMIGVIAGAFFTTHAWLTATGSSMVRKIVTTAAVVTTCIAVTVFAREYLGRLLPG